MGKDYMTKLEQNREIIAYFPHATDGKLFTRRKSHPNQPIKVSLQPLWQPKGPIAKSDGERDIEWQSPAATLRTHRIKNPLDGDENGRADEQIDGWKDGWM